MEMMEATSAEYTYPLEVFKLSPQNLGWRSFSLSLMRVSIISKVSVHYASEDEANLLQPTLWSVLLQGVAR